MQVIAARGAGADSVTVERDFFGHKAPKVAALLSQSSSAHVLLLGTDLNDWETDFAGYFEHLVHARLPTDLDSALSAGPSFQLILASLKGIASVSHEAAKLLRRLRTVLTDSGSLVLLAENRISLTELAHNTVSVLSAGKTTAPAFRLRLRKAGFERVEEFLPIPRFCSAEEFVSVRHGNAALPSDASAIEIGLNKIGLLATFSEGWCNVCSGPGGGTGTLLDKIAGQLNEGSGTSDSVVIERFDLRDRGALVLLLHTVPTKRRLVCRITTDGSSDRSVRRNADWTERIHRSHAISPSIKQFVPRPIGTFPLNKGMEYVEELIEGTIAWKLAGKSRIERVMFDGMCDFLLEFNRETVADVSINDTLFTRLSLSPHAISMDRETAALTDALTQRLRESTLGSDRRLVWSHGDFGYGNAIAEPRTGRLSGIFDWDQAREDLAGVDLLNFLIFREHTRAKVPLTMTIASVADRIVDHGLRGIDIRIRYEDEFPLTGRHRLELLAWVSLRIAQRAATYPALLARSRDEVQSLLRWACNALSE